MQVLTPYEYLKVDTANCFGYDKKTWDERIAWFDNNEMHLETLTDEADEIWGYRKAVAAVRDAQNGIPTGHIMGLDATASGYGIIACLTGCIKTATKVNLVNTGKRECIYQSFADYMTMICGHEILREIVKEPVMTKVYNSTSKPKTVFGEGTPELEAFLRTIAEECPGAMEYLEDVQTLWDSKRDVYTWSLPNGHTARCKVMEIVDARIEINEIKMSFTHRTKVNKPIDYGLMLQANIVQSIDGYIVQEMILRCKNSGFEMLAIFDDFRASPNHMQKVREHYIDILCEIADSNLLSDILTEIAGYPIQFQKLSDNLSDYIREAEYPLS